MLHTPRTNVLYIEYPLLVRMRSGTFWQGDPGGRGGHGKK
jgi:hypothetical protein